MYEVKYYRDDNGYSEIEKLIESLNNQNGKDARVQLAKIKAYIEMLEKYGKSLGFPYVRPIIGSKELWELRPLRHRILFVAWYNNSFILLTHFIKRTDKTPKAEIERAERMLRKMKESDCDE